MSATRPAEIPRTAEPPAAVDAVVVGAGFSGMYMLHRLRRAGLSTLVFEAGSDVGGTWFWNCYPGARVDAESLQYSYSFSSELQQEWHWSENYAPRAELLSYANHVADRFSLRSDIQFGTRVTSASYNDAESRWDIATDRGEQVSARYFINAVGCLSATNVPAFDGLETFDGDWYHTARWPREGVDLTGKTVAVVGTGSTGIQVIPAIAEQATHLFVYQRTPNYSLPSRNGPMDPEREADWKGHYDEHRAAARMSFVGTSAPPVADRSALSVSDSERNEVYEQAWARGGARLMRCFNDITRSKAANDTAADFVRNKIRAAVHDQQVAEMLVPRDYPIGAKRICMDTKYFETYNRDNVTLVDIRKNPIEEITPHGLRTTADSYDVDVLVFATGFDAMTGGLLKLDIRGRGGLMLKDKWEAGPRTYLGIQTSGFPNMFIVAGPGSPSVLSNMINSIEQHVEWIGDAISHLERGRITSMEPTVEAEDDWVEHVNEVAEQTLYMQASSWYLGANIPGKPRVFMPYVGGVGAYRLRCDEVAAAGYQGFDLVDERARPGHDDATSRG